MKLKLLLATCCAALAFPASAGAISCAPPGNAGVDQYFETVPGSSCNHSSTPPSGHHGGGLPPGTSHQLANLGKVGQAVANLVSSSGTGVTSSSGAGGSRTSGSGHKNAGNGAKSGTPVTGSGRNPLSGILHPVLTGSSSGGVGVLLPIFLVGALVLVLLATVVRRRLGSSGPST